MPFLAVGAIIIGILMIALDFALRPHITPAEDVRVVVERIDASQVEACRIEALEQSRTVTDGESRKLLLAGLKKAYYPAPMRQNRVDSITLILADGMEAGPFSFSLDSRRDAFSPEFIAGLEREGILILDKQSKFR